MTLASYLTDYTVEHSPVTTDGPPPYAFGFDGTDLANVANGVWAWANIDVNGCLVIDLDGGKTYARYAVHHDADDSPAYVVRQFPPATAEELHRAQGNGAPWLTKADVDAAERTPAMTGGQQLTLVAEPARPEVQLLNDALATITGGRQDSYGNPEDSFTVIADFWTTYWTARNVDMFTAEDVANMMILMKTARQIHAPKRDNYVDIAGYAGLGQRTVEKGAGR